MGCDESSNTLLPVREEGPRQQRKGRPEARGIPPARAARTGAARTELLPDPRTGHAPPDREPRARGTREKGACGAGGDQEQRRCRRRDVRGGAERSRWAGRGHARRPVAFRWRHNGTSDCVTPQGASGRVGRPRRAPQLGGGRADQAQINTWEGVPEDETSETFRGTPLLRASVPRFQVCACAGGGGAPPHRACAVPCSRCSFRHL